ncbi:polyketide synthase, variant 2 [Blastomyces dermatitidis ATCC 18188]|uniref:Non-reducing polyketide synthase nscA n=1 Tax=Ajellomyces dermatitidis (strain ATCC 18188 / CBS 674.68) TaxID=653446 RepID=F2TAE1_AJEDA|nr:polyketide synthase [Blastomyces dermatitidis ATCC 18188]KMW67209.1 polyketide synthase, variant 1 [Blastomyces dermatitidis ATCC 18188]KMW67210.1 polyketide synthase, variant 2 [Blastomyces dermatitidis ATCC 18188]
MSVMGDHNNMTPLAIVGLSARYAQEASTPEKFWEFLLRGRQSTTPIPKDRFNADAYYHPDLDHGGTFHVKGGHFLSENPLGFDAGFFRISQTEVLTMDPQQRLVMENVYHALENAGIPLDQAISSKTAVFAAGFNHDHRNLLNMDIETSLKHKSTGSEQSIISNRVSWFYDFHGPSVTIDTACSSGLVSLHLAAQSLKSGDSEMAVVTGGSVISHVGDIIAFSHSGVLGASGKCFTFDHRAEGYARGEGVGTVIVKRLSDALRDGNTIRAVIRGTLVNQDGRTPGISLPSAQAQEALIRHLYSNAKLDPRDTMFVEAHGTGTPVGDPIETRAITSAFGSEHRKEPLYVGALKASIGHLEGGAGIAGVIKSVMILEAGIITPNANFEKVNPNIPKDEWNLEFPTECIPWPKAGARRISVNSFGFGGTNAHCILDDAYHFLQEQGLNGIHRTRIQVPTKLEINQTLTSLNKLYGELQELTNGNRELTHGDTINGTNGENENGSNGKMLNGVNGNAVNGTNGEPANETNGELANGTNGEPANETNGENTVGTNNETMNGINGESVDRTNGEPVSEINGENTIGPKNETVNGTNGEAVNDTNGETVNGSHEVPNSLSSGETKAPRLFILSAFDKEGVTRTATDLRNYLATKTSLLSNDAAEFLSDLAYTLSQRRSDFRWKSHVVADSIPELEESLSTVKARPKPANTDRPPRIGFVFTGQGAQYCRMGKQFMIYPVFRKSLEDATQYMKAVGSPWSLIDELLREQETSKIHNPAIAHPASTSIQVAIVELLASWNIYPARVVGHSSGEIAAAYCAGKISRESAWGAAYYRGFVSAKEQGVKGSMIAVGLSQEKLQEYLDKVHTAHKGELVVACYNSPRNNTVSGDEVMIDVLKELLDAEDIFARKLKVQNAYHSSHMQKLAEDYLELMGSPPAGQLFDSNHDIQMFSTISGKRVKDVELTTQYWADNMVSPVRFTDGLRSMIFHPDDSDLESDQFDKTWIDEIIEVGPHSALQSAIKQTIAATASAPPISYMSLLNRQDSTLRTMMDAVGSLNGKAAPVNIYEVNHGFAGQEGNMRTPQMLVWLPPYSFNHDERGYYESRLSKKIRYREFPRHQLFGAPVQDWNRQNRKWRHFLRTYENPWLKEHMVTGRCVLPASAYLTMVTEAVRQVTGDAVKLTGIRLKNVSIKSALVVPDTREGVEVSLSIHPVNESNHWESTVWKWFQVCSYIAAHDDWIEHCSGYFSVEHKTSPDPIDNGRESEAATQAWKDEIEQGAQSCQRPLDIGKLFDNFETVGLKYGPLFKNLSNITANTQQPGVIMGTATTPELASAMPKGYLDSHVIHPVTLDSMFVSGLVAICDHGRQTVLKRPMVPTFIKESWISADNNAQAGVNFRCHGQASPEAYDSYSFDIKCSDGADDQPRVSLSGVRFTPLSDEDASLSGTQQHGYAMDWTLDIDMLESPEFHQALSVEPSATYEEQQNLFEKLQLASALLITDALEALKGTPVKPPTSHLRKYYEWMHLIADNVAANSVVHAPLELCKKYSEDPSLKQELYQEVEKLNKDGELMVRLGLQIPEIMRDEVDPLYLMFGQDDIMTSYYEEVLHEGDATENVDAYLSLLGDNYSDLEILEIGAGTGSFARLLLGILAPRSGNESTDSTNTVAQYTFTDISPSFFSKAKENLSEWADLLTFEKLDIERDPTTQGFSAKKYDMIIAHNVLHATPELGKSLENTQRLLKPGGKLVVHEVVRPDIVWPSLIFGLLSGWWLSNEPNREWCPLITLPEWDALLRQRGFSGVEIEIPNSRYPEFVKLSTMISSAVPDSPDSGRTATDVVILAPASRVEHDFIPKLQAELAQNAGVTNCTVMQLHEFIGKDRANVICISLLELETPVLLDISEEDFKNLQQYFSTCKRLLWITGDPAAQPAFNMSTGMVRTLRWERDAESPNFVTLALGTSSSSPTRSTIDLVSKIFRYQFTSGQMKHQNAEYLLRDGLIYINHILDHPSATSFLRSQFSTLSPELVPWKDTGRPVKLQNSTRGVLNKLQWVTDAASALPLGDSDIEVDICAVGLNFVDLLSIMGEGVGDVVGREAAGVVTRVGSGVRHLQAGDRVVYLTDSPKKGTFHSHGRVNESLAIRIPNNMSFEFAAGLPVIYATVIYSLTNVGRLVAGEKILIHSAAGGVGQAAIQYAQEIGAEIFATVSSVEKMEFLKKEYGILEDHIFSSRDTSFVQGIMRMTKNSGVDLVLNSLSQEALRKSFECVAPFGRFIEIGKKDLQAGGKLDMTPFLQNISFTGVDLLTLAESRPKIVGELLNTTIRLWEENKIKGAHPLTTLGYSELEDGLRMLQSGKNIGKIVFAPNEKDIVPVIPEVNIPYTFEANASYVLAGGLGGLGRSLARWMVSRGARHLVFLSRSGKITQPVQEMVAELEGKGCEIRIFTCDVSDASRLHAVVEECQQTLPPIKGCIQGSMVLRDSLFENLTYADWTATIKPKAQGSQNLHDVLPKDLDFFVMLSSLAGVMGGRSQANYAAGNTYQDALAKHRVANGLRAASFDIGGVLSVGFVAENQNYARNATKAMIPIREDEVHAVVEYLVDPRHEKTQSTCQVLFGLATKKSSQERGVPPPECFNYPLFTLLQKTSGSQQQGSEETDTYCVDALLGAARSREEAAEIALNGILNKLSVLLNVSSDQIDPGKSTRSNGVDSLIAIEFRTWLAKEAGTELSLIDVTVGGSINELSQKVASLSRFVQGNISDSK